MAQGHEGAPSTLIVGQSGGPTAVINSSLVGVLREARAQGIRRVYGMRYGIRGLLLGDLGCGGLSHNAQPDCCFIGSGQDSCIPGYDQNRWWRHCRSRLLNQYQQDCKNNCVHSTSFNAPQVRNSEADRAARARP